MDFFSPKPTSSERIKQFPGFSVDHLGQRYQPDPEVLRMGNLGTDLWPPLSVLETPTRSVFSQNNNQYWPFIGDIKLRKAVAQKVAHQARQDYSAENVAITCGATEAMVNVFHAITDPEDEVILLDPTYVGMIYRIKLVGAIPVLVPFYQQDEEWRIDLERLEASINNRTKAIFIMNPATPHGAVLNLNEWEAIARLCQKNQLWLVYNAAMERILFDNRQVIHPALLEGMYDYTITIGSLSKEYRMVNWRIGWVVAPKEILNEIAVAHIYNVITSTGVSQEAGIAALKEPDSAFNNCLEKWEKRRDIVNRALANYDMIPAAGGWSQVLDVAALGIDAQTAAEMLMTHGKVNATPMDNWGEVNGKYLLRLVFSNESEERLKSLGERFYKTFGR